jgi:hypothetical protein
MKQDCTLSDKPRILTGHRPASGTNSGRCTQPELAVERLREGIVGWLAWPGEVEGHALAPGPEIEVLEGCASILDCAYPVYAIVGSTFHSTKLTYRSSRQVIS